MRGVPAPPQAVVEAESIIDQRVDGFLHWLDTRGTVPTIRALREHADHLRRAEVERAVRLLAKGEDPAKVIEALSHGLTNKLLHAPTRFLNEADGAPGDGAELVQRLFNLDKNH